MQSEAQTLECDLLVIGGGMAGMSAAARAAESGARVVVVEKAPEVGGSALMSGGYFWTLPSFRQLRANDDGELQDIVSSGYAAAINWLKSRDVPMSAPMEVVNGRGQQVDMITHMKSCQSSVQSAGGYIVAGTQVRRLLKEGVRVVGAETSHPDGDVTVQAKWTLLATGGYQGSPELRAKYMRPEAVNFQLRSNPYSVGDGLRLAEEAGSTYAGPNPGFYGHLIAYPCKLDKFEKFRELCQYQSDFSLLLNQQGNRFCDEGLREHRNANAVAFLPEGKALLFWDQAVHEGHVVKPLVPSHAPTDKLDIALENGAQGARLDRIEDLAAAAATWGFNGEQAVRTILAFNDAMKNGPIMLSPERTGETVPINKPPFRAVVVHPGVTFSHGGVWIDRSARALNTIGEPVPGLLVAGADAGNIFRRGYGGGLALALTSALLAMKTAGFGN